MPHRQRAISSPRRRNVHLRTWSFLLLAAFAALVVLRWQETPVGSITDDTYYIAMARSLAAGQGPVVQPGPDVPAANPGLFPPGFPLLLSPLARLQPDGLDVLKLVPLFAALALLALGWRLTRDDDAAARLLLLAGLALNPWLIAWSTRVLSDLPFAALALAALLAAGRLIFQPSIARTDMVGVVVLTGAAMLVRSVGVVVLLAITASLLQQRRWTRAGVFVVGVALTQSVLAVPGWSAGSFWLGDGYRAQLMAHHTGLGARAAFMAGNLIGYLRELPVLMIPAFGQPLRSQVGTGAALALQSLAAIALCALLALGVRRRLDAPSRGPAVVLLWYLGFTVLALTNFDGWPSGVQTRLLLPLLPVLWYLVAAGVPAGRARGLLMAIVVAASLAHNGWRVAHPLGEASAAAGHGFVDPGDGRPWISAHTAPGDIILAQEPLPRHVRLNRMVIALGEPDLAPMKARAAQYGARWLLLAPSVHGTPRRLDETGARWQELLQREGWVPAWSDTQRAVFIYRVPD